MKNTEAPLWVNKTSRRSLFKTGLVVAGASLLFAVDYVTGSNIAKKSLKLFAHENIFGGNDSPPPKKSSVTNVSYRTQFADIERNEETEPLPFNPGIMFLGDSLFALGKIPTYVADDIKTANKTAHFVGDMQTSGNLVSLEGHGGFNTAMMVRQLTDDNIANWTELNGKQTPKNFNYHIPDVVVIQLGTNDANNISKYRGQNIAIDINTYTIDNYKKIIAYLRSKNPHVRIIVSKIPKCVYTDVNQIINEINTAFYQMVYELNTSASRVILMPGWDNDLDPAIHLADDFHPNEAGQKIMAKRFAEVLLPMFKP